MRRYVLLGAVGLALIALFGVGLWRQWDEWRRRTIVNPDGSRITYLGATYGRKHTITEWKLQWGWLPIRRVVHRTETPFDTLYLWFRVVIPAVKPASKLPPGVVVMVPLSSIQEYKPYAVRLSDGRTVSEQPMTMVVTTIPMGQGTDHVGAHHFPGLPADGRTAQLEFHREIFGWGTSPRARNEAPLRMTIRLPRAPIVDQITKPEPLPAMREKGGLRVRLTGFQWDYMCIDTPFEPWDNRESVFVEPQFVLEPTEGSPEDWAIKRMGFVPIGAGRPLYVQNWAFAPPYRAEVQGNWDAPVYHFAVEFKNRRTGKYVTFDFWVPPPPFEQLRRQWEFAEMSRKAIAAKDYARAIQVWEGTGEAFAIEASYWRGYAYAMRGDYANAIREFQKVLPRLTSVSDRRGMRLALVCCLLLAERRAEAKPLARDYIQQVYQHKDFLWGIDENALVMGLLLPDAMPSDAVINARLQLWREKARANIQWTLIDAIERVRSVQFARRGEYGRAIRALKAGRDHYRHPCRDALFFAWFHQQRGERALAQKWLRNARAALPQLDHPNLWDLVLLGRVLFPKAWEL